MGVLPRPIYQVTWKTARFVWGLEHEKTLQEVQAAVQAAAPLGPYDPADSMVLEVEVAGWDAIGDFGRPYTWTTQRSPLRF